MNLLHTVVSAFIDNYSAIAGALTACYESGVFLSFVILGFAFSGFARKSRTPQSNMDVYERI